MPSAKLTIRSNPARSGACKTEPSGRARKLTESVKYGARSGTPAAVANGFRAPEKSPQGPHVARGEPEDRQRCPSGRMSVGSSAAREASWLGWTAWVPVRDRRKQSQSRPGGRVPGQRLRKGGRGTSGHREREGIVSAGRGGPTPGSLGEARERRTGRGRGSGVRRVIHWEFLATALSERTTTSFFSRNSSKSLSASALAFESSSSYRSA